MVNEQQYHKLVDRLQAVINRKEQIIVQANALKKEYSNLEEEEQVLETMIMFAYNKLHDANSIR